MVALAGVDDVPATYIHRFALQADPANPTIADTDERKLICIKVL